MSGNGCPVSGDGSRATLCAAPRCKLGKCLEDRRVTTRYLIFAQLPLPHPRCPLGCGLGPALLPLAVIPPVGNQWRVERRPIPLHGMSGSKEVPPRPDLLDR